MISKIRPGNKLQKKTLVEMTYERLKDDIWNCDYNPGDKIIIRQLSEKYGVSSTCAREAINWLTLEGYLESSPYKEARVAIWDLQTIEEIYEMRLELEPMATEKAIKLLDDDEIDQLIKLTEQIESYTNNKNYRELFKVNRDLHMKLYQTAGNQYLMRFIESLWILRVVQPLIYIEGHAKALCQDHLELITAIKNQDARGGAEVIRQHMVRSKAGAKQYIKHFTDWD